MDNMVSDTDKPKDAGKRTAHPFRKAVLRGLGVVSPPLFTVLIFLWVIFTTERYLLEPVTGWVRDGLVLWTNEIREEVPLDNPPRTTDGRLFEQLDDHKYVPKHVYDTVRKSGGEEPMPQSAKAVYRRYVELEHLQPWRTIPCFLAVFILLLYLLGRFMAAGIGRFFWNLFEQGVHRLPLVRNVYSSVKQVSDFLFTEREVEYTRVVAVEYPRKGIWSLGLVTGESMLEIRSAAAEPVLSVLMPTSPMPMTGFTVTVLKSETIDLNITVDQAFQFIVSCGVVVPPQQLQQMLADSEPAADGAVREPARTDPNDSSQPAVSGK